jgi:hypothetical protein
MACKACALSGAPFYVDSCASSVRKHLATANTNTMLKHLGVRNIQIYLDICVSIRNFELSLEGRMHLGNKNKMVFILYFARFK